MQKQVIRAVYDKDTITVYQAYNNIIADNAVQHQRFLSPPFKKERMTWIKPSFLWMMYRSGWATKENQERVLAIKIKREGFEWALDNSCMARYDDSLYPSNTEWKEILKSSPVRIQWDPEKDIHLRPLPYRSIQIGLSGMAVDKYVSEWVVQIEDITARCHEIHSIIKANDTDHASLLLPNEVVYPLPETIRARIAATKP